MQIFSEIPVPFTECGLGAVLLVVKRPGAKLPTYLHLKFRPILLPVKPELVACC
jgi:hypothetical protein